MSERSIRRSRIRAIERRRRRAARVAKQTLAATAIGIGAIAVATPAADAATFNVVNTDDGTGPTPPGSLRAAIEDANATAGDDRVVFSSSLSGDTITLVDELEVDLSAGDLEIEGPAAGKATVSGDDSYRILDTYGTGRLSVSGLALTDGYADSTDGVGGAIYSEGDLAISDVAFTGNYAYHGGGAIYTTGETLSINDSTFTGNESYGNCGCGGGGGPGVEGGGGAVAAYDADGISVTISDSTFDGNTADSSGGAVFVGSDNSGTDPADLTVSRSTFTGNVSYAGGAIETHYATLKIADSSFTGNAAEKYGGGISAALGEVDLDNVTVTGNQTAGVAAAMALLGADGSIKGATIDGNTATAPPAPAIGGALLISSKYGLEIAQTTISGNQSTGFAGGAYPDFASGGGMILGAVTLADSNVTNNSTDGYGPGGILALAAQIERTTVSGNTSVSGVGGIQAKYGGTTISRSTVSGNQGTVGGIAAYDDDSSSDPPDPAYALTLTNSTVSGNTATGSSTTAGARSGYGGGLYLSGEVGGTIRNSTIANNSAELGGGGVFSYAGPDSGDYTTIDRSLSSTIVADNKAAGAANDLGSDNGGNPDRGFVAGFSLIENAGGVSLDSNPAGSNILGSEPRLGPLADNGGPTRTLLPAAGSPAIDSGTANGLAVDQRGQPRSSRRGPGQTGDGTDIGSVELPADTTPPVTTITSGPADGSTVLVPSVSFGFTASEEGTFECQIDGSAWSPCSSPAQFDGLGNGSHTFAVRATDEAGNVGNVATRSFEVVLGFCNGTPATIVAVAGEPTVGTSGPDVIAGTDGPDTIDARGGDDVVCGADGDDQITGGGGDDQITGQAGDDTVRGGAGLDELFGEGGGDTLIGGADDDRLQGGNGDDQLRGNGGVDTLDGRQGSDVLAGHQGADVLGGGPAADTITGGKGADQVRGGKGPDELRGNDGNDEIRGAKAADELFGGKGNDFLNGGKGDNACDGGPGENELRNCG